MAQLLVAATFILIFIGGMVTSKGAGLAVPDWPLSYGTFNPPGWWHIENVRLEHGHRLFASFVGLITTVLAIGLWMTEKRRWVRWLGVGAFFGVLAQGILGGLRVNLISTELAMVHACVAQAFFCLAILLAMATSPNFNRSSSADSPSKAANKIKMLTLVFFITVYFQIILGAVMRHMGAGLAIPDFPLVFGGLVPTHWDTGILIHFLHRVGALLVSIGALSVSLFVFAERSINRPLIVPAFFLLVIVGFQVFLGAQVIWLGRPPVVTTLHVLSGALILGTSFALMVRSRLL